MVGALPQYSMVYLDNQKLRCVTSISVQASSSGPAEVAIEVFNHDLKHPYAELDGVLYSHEEHDRINRICGLLRTHALTDPDNPLWAELTALLDTRTKNLRTLPDAFADQRTHISIRPTAPEVQGEEAEAGA